MNGKHSESAFNFLFYSFGWALYTHTEKKFYILKENFIKLHVCKIKTSQFISFADWSNGHNINNVHFKCTSES